MAFGGGGGFSFGSNNNTNTTPSFGGFGSNNNNSGGFGSTSSGGAFGSSTTQNNPFGGGGGGGGSAFGSGSGGFGSNSNNSSSLFGASKPASNPFGTTSSTTGGGLFGSSNNASTGGAFGTSTGGFGSNSNTATNAFGNNSNTFGGFGAQNKPSFGSNTSSTPLFGQGGQGTTGGFGSGGFGSSGSGTALSNQPVPPSDGTLNPPFTAVTEKDGNSTNVFQSINAMPAYSKYSFEELRLADYNAGRRWGNGATAGAGAFGSSTFGGFGQTNTGGAFGSNNNSSNLFGSSTTTTAGGFGANTSTAFGSGTGGLFGNKPASSNLFGQQSSGTTSGGLFGTSNNQQPSSNPFGSSSFGSNTNTGGGLFGGNNNSQTQQKPSLFGASNTNSNTGSGFSFGNNSNTTNTGGGLFGNTNNQQQQQQQQSGGLFGNNANQQKPSLFGNSTTGPFGASNTQSQPSGGLFGTSNTGNSGGGLFGNTSNNTNTGGGLFGNNQQQSNTGGGLFGNSNNATNKPGGLFGNTTFGNNNQQGSGGGLFGNSNNQQGGGLFANNSNNNTSGGFSFGNSNQNKPTTSLFGGNTSNNQSGGLFNTGNTNTGGMFGSSQSNQQQNQQQQEQFKHSSLLDPNPYGQSSIWTGLPQPNLENSKPLVTALTATQKLKESQAKPPPSLRLNQSRYMTPPRRNGFGFSYSTYGTPNSVASTPGGNGLGNSMYGSRFTGGSFGRSMGKAASVSSLRTQYLDGESVLTPGAFAPSASRYSSGSIRRLTIDKSIRNDLFTRPPLPALLGDKAVTNGTPASQPSLPPSRPEPAQEVTGKLKKRVSFEKDLADGTNGSLNGDTGALVRTESDEEASFDESGSSVAPNGAHKGKELAPVPEDHESEAVSSKKRSEAAVKTDPKPGDYWMKPTRAELSKIPRDKLQNFRNFEVGRVGCGKVVFNDPVDLTALDLNDLYEKIIEIRLRSVTVYPDGTLKPQRGKGLNVPSTISIENSWPRNRGQVSSVTSGPAFDKHVNRLKKIPGTTFVNYEPETGVWTFKVPHYTRYGLDYDEDEEDDFGDSQLSAPPDSIQQLKSADASVMEVDSDGYESSGQDDTFALQHQRQKTVPGGFSRKAMFDDDMEDDSVVPAPEQDEGSEHSLISEDERSDDEMDMAGSYPAPTGPVLNFDSPVQPILKPGQAPGTPGGHLLDLEGDWAEQLQRTISPRKQNRDALREVQSKVLLDRAYEPIKPATRKNEFRSSIDVMNAIFGGEGKSWGGQREAEAGFEFPYAKRAKTFDQSEHQMSAEEIAWHASFKPNFSPQNELVIKTSKLPVSAEWNADILARSETRIISANSLKDNLKISIPDAMAGAAINLVGQVPKIEYSQVPFSTLKDQLPLGQRNGSQGSLYELLHVLFDTYEDDFSYNLSEPQRREFEHRIRKDRLSKFLSTILTQQSYPIKNADDAAGVAFQHLAVHNIHAACETLMKAKYFNLAMLVAQIENADALFQQDIADQIAAWKDQNIISEMTEETRSLYELLSGNTTICQGKTGGPAEDRATTFLLSEKYELSWPQCFALELWYGHTKNGSVEEAIEDFAEKVSEGEETATPVNADGKEDPMWVVLKLFASSMKVKTVPVPTLPNDLSALSKPFDVSNTFALYQAIQRGLGKVRAKVDTEKADQLVADYAFQLEARGDLVGTVWALTHLSNNSKRGKMMVDLLCRHAEKLAPPPSDRKEAGPQWTALTGVLKIPEGWICQAKALYCRSINSRFEELHYLVLAREWEDAHDCLCRRVAPRLVIDEDYEMLDGIISAFGDKPENAVEGWSKGGQIYGDLVGVVWKGGLSAPARRAALARLQDSLSDMGARLGQRGTDISAGGLEELEERVAVKEMGRTVARLLEAEGANTKEVVQLPLTDEVKAGLTKKMAGEYYRRVMGGGK